jgi:hypothetical protein
MKRKIQMGVSIGGPTIIMIFVVLCLTTLGTLSLVTANADLKLSEKTAIKTISYYEADSLGEAFLAKLDTLLLYSVADKTFAAIQKIENTTASINADGSLSVMHSIDMDQDQKLIIMLHVPQSPAADQKRYVIQSWKIVNNNAWNYEDFETQFDDTVVQFDDTVVQFDDTIVQ